MAASSSAAASHTPHTIKPRLLKAVATGDLILLEQALGLKPSPAPAEQGDLSCLDGVTAAGSSALHIAASRGHLELVRTLCAQLPSLIRRRNNLGDTALICAARAGHEDVADHLAELAVEENDDGNPTLRATNSGGETAMHEAVRNGHVRVLKKLMDRDSALSEVVDGNGVSPLYLAVASNRADMVKVLTKDGVKSSARYSGPDGQTALHAAVYASRVDNYGRTSLHSATVLAQKLELVELLLSNNSSLAYIQDDEGLFPIHVAAIMGNVTVVRKFIEICLDYDELLDNKRRNILHCAVEHGRVMLVRHICGNPKFSRMMNARDGEGNTPLHLSVKHGRALIFFFLMVDPRVNLDIMNNEGSTPLDVASTKIQSDDTLSSFKNTFIIRCLNLCEGYGSPCHLAKNLRDDLCLEEKESSIYTNVLQSMFNYSIVIVFSSASALSAASSPPGGYITEGADAGKPVHGVRTGFWIFIFANIISFFLSIPTIFLFVFTRQARDSRFYLILSAAMFLGAILSTLITFVMLVQLTLDPENRWVEYIFLRLVSADLAVPIGLQVATQLWTSKHRWQDISKVIVQAILLIHVIHVIRASMGTMQSLVKSVPAVRQEPCSWTGCVDQDDAVFYPT